MQEGDAREREHNREHMSDRRSPARRSDRRGNRSNNVATVGSPIHPNARDAIVMPNCVAEIKEGRIVYEPQRCLRATAPGGKPEFSRRVPPHKTPARIQRPRKTRLATTKNNTANNFAKIVINGRGVLYAVSQNG